MFIQITHMLNEAGYCEGHIWDDDGYARAFVPLRIESNVDKKQTMAE